MGEEERREEAVEEPEWWMVDAGVGDGLVDGRMGEGARV
jgi:hypothetical protein